MQTQQTLYPCQGFQLLLLPAVEFWPSACIKHSGTKPILPGNCYFKSFVQDYTIQKSLLELLCFEER